MLCVWFVYFYVWPDMVLNQRQVLVIVSDWEPYLGSRGFTVYFVGDCSCLCVVVHQTGCIRFSRSVFVFV